MLTPPGKKEMSLQVRVLMGSFEHGVQCRSR
jgi:hypothetical protein